MAACKMCGANILWSRTVAGKGIPLSLPPIPNGNAWIEEGKVHVASAEHPKPDGVRSYRLHFLECAPYKAKKELERRLKS